MWRDPIVEEVRAAREAYAKRFNYDLRAIYLDLKKQEKKSGQKMLSLSPRRVQPDQKAAPLQHEPSN